ncbi:MAG: hypothetical protein KF842_09795 [Caulobacter sp.]|nr:hypothetical protein [Caulobacter sp.]
MFRSVLIAAAALLVTACVTPRSIEMQNPTLGYKAADKIMVGVVEDRQRVKDGKPPNFAGYARVYGAPVDWTVDVLTMSDKTGKGKSMSRYLAERVAAGLKSGGADVMVMQADRVATDEEADIVMARENAGAIVTIVNHDWHFDVNTNWVGKFQFNSDVDVVIQKRGRGTVLTKRFADKQAIQGEGSESWPNMITDAYKAKLEQIFNDPEVKAALTN